MLDSDRHTLPGGRSASKKTTLIRHFTDLAVWKKAFQLGQDIFALTSSWPADERSSLSEQVRRSSRSVSTHIARAWAKRRCEAQFVSKLADADTELHETENWLMFAGAHGYITDDGLNALLVRVHEVRRMLASLMAHSTLFLLKSASSAPDA